ncbi:NADPH-dependent F420 reductase [Xanthobacter autotrophicus DSM 431]|uniref:NADPH-dependent F420 reductase n=1 Tax=Xanthobacter nonsaccharivorans TaxID=3119912 RepID=UPI00372BA3B2
MSTPSSIAIIGGSGDLGSGLAKRWAAAGHRVILGSRSAEKAAAAAAELGAAVGKTLEGTDNRAAAAAADLVVVAVPFSSHAETLADIRAVVEGKIVVDAVVPLKPPKVATVQLPDEGSAAQIAQALLGAGTRVVSAFHNVGASKLHAGEPVGCDVLVFGDDKEAREVVIALVADIGARGIDGGALANSAAAEALTSVLIGINRRYKVQGAGIRITGLPEIGAGEGGVA